MKMGLYARVSTYDQQTLTLQRDAMTAYAKQRGGSIVKIVEDVGSGAGERRQREALMRAARRREIDAIVVWRLDRWGRSLADLIVTLQELHELGVGFISLHEALDLTTPTGRAMAGMLAVFAEFERGILRERVKAGIAEARRRGKRHGRPPTVAHRADEARQLRVFCPPPRKGIFQAYSPDASQTGRGANSRTIFRILMALGFLRNS